MDHVVQLRRTLEELRRAVDTRDTFLLIMAGHHVRKCILDGSNSLAIRVSRRKRRRLSFPVPLENEYDRLVAQEGPTFSSHMDGLSPRFAMPNRQFEDVGLDRFLASPAARVSGVDVSVKDVVLHVANVVGGSHVGSPRNETAALLDEVSGRLFVGAADAGATVGIMRGISDVVVHSLQPLVE